MSKLGIVGYVALGNILIFVSMLLIFFNTSIVPRIERDSATNVVAVLMLAAGGLIWHLLHGAGADEIKRVKKWADLFWNIWGLIGIYALTRKSLMGGNNNLEGIISSLSSQILTLVIIGLFVNAVVRVAVTLAEISG